MDEGLVKMHVCLAWLTHPTLQPLGYMEMVQTRDAATLLLIIQRHVAVIHSDQWRAYTRPVVSHQTVNHSINFVDPTTGVHMQHSESYWNRVKIKLKRMRGYHIRQLPGYLDEFMWREGNWRRCFREYLM